MTDDVTPLFPTYAAQRLTMLLRVRDHDHHGSLLVHLMQRARRNKVAGATAFEAFEGFGGSKQIHRTHSLSDDAPVTLVIVDRPERIESFLKDAAELLNNVLITVTDVRVVEL
jgi:PII-like signaling protein